MVGLFLYEKQQAGQNAVSWYFVIRRIGLLQLPRRLLR